MFKLLVLSCLLGSCLADPFGLPSWLREAGRQLHHPRGCANRAEGWRACARLNSNAFLAPHDHDCSLFFYCNGGARPVCRKCPAGLHFHPQLQVCDWPGNVDCAPRPPHPPCPHYNETTPYPTKPDDDATVTVIYGSTKTDRLPTDETTTDGTTTDETTTDETTTNETTTDGPPTYETTTDGTTTDETTTEETTNDETTTNETTTDETTTDETTTDGLPTDETTTDPINSFSWQNYMP